ncbi:MAG TPA: AraC family transcriptional regulator [Thiothrix sp.]|nr:AraC family transcriptional regulator [Thiothrix sp.]
MTKNKIDRIPIEPEEDTLAQVLNSMRISGSLLLKDKYTTPWAVSIPDSDTLNRVFETSRNVRIAAFHLVESGRIKLRVDEEEDNKVIKRESAKTISLEAGEIAVCFSGNSHILYEGNQQNVIPFQELLTKQSHDIQQSAFQQNLSQQNGKTSLVCGAFLLDDSFLNPLLASLPKVLKFNLRKQNPRLLPIVKLLMEDFHTATTSSGYVIPRYLELLCTDMVRGYVNSLPEQSKGWLSAINDPVVGRAIDSIHHQPGHDWTVKKLADKVSISPSRFAARFRDKLGESPMMYVARWRMHIASQMMVSNQQSIEQIASVVGYESLSAFSRAFKRHAGLPPATWRSQAR